MEWDCRLVKRSVVHGHNSSNSKALLLSVILVLSFLICGVKPLYIDCEHVQQSGNCECSKLDVYSIDCPKRANVYPIQLKLTNNRNPDEAFLQVTCNFFEQPTFQWELIEGVDLSEDKISAKVTKLSFNRCPAIPNALKNLLNRINISSEYIQRFTLQYSENITIPDEYVSEFPNLDTLNLSQNQLEELPDLALAPNLVEVNVRSNRIKILKPNSFSSNTKLKRIVLSHNQIESIPPNTFPSSVEFLELSGVKLAHLTKESLLGLTNLQFLNLENAPLKNSDPECFDNLVNLTELWLNRVQFKDFPTFKNLPKLTNLFINGIRVEQQPITIENLPSLAKITAIASKLNVLPRIRNVPSIKIVDLSRNRIQNLTKEFFTQISTITMLDLSENDISELVEIRSPYLEILQLGKNKISRLPKTAFVHLPKLTDLSISNNQIDDVDYNAFDNQGYLQRLDLSHNNISRSNSPFSHVPDLDGLGSFSGYSFINKCVRLRYLNLSYNSFDMIYDDWRNTFASLESLDLSHNRIKEITAQDLQFITNINLQLNLTNNDITRFNLRNHWMFQYQEHSSTTNVYIDGNPIFCDCWAFLVKNFPVKSHRLVFDHLACKGPQNLLDIPLSKVEDKQLLCYLEQSQCLADKCSCWQRPSDTVILVNCSNSHLTTSDLPVFNWSSQPQFNTWKIALDFSGNNISRMDFTFFTDLPERVQFIDLSSNHLTSIGFLNTLGENSTTNFSLSGNPFACDSCTDFVVIWATQTSKIVDSDNITCWKKEGVDESYVRQTVHDLSELVEDCSNQINTAGIQILIICLAVLATLCVILVIFMVRFSWVIKAFLFSKGWGWCLFWDADLDEDGQEKVYDAFVSYSHKDEEWVVDELVNRLEEQEGFKLCLHFRDWTPGDWIPDQIVRSVDQSKRTVVILSKNFVESVWSRLEFKAAHAQALSQGSNRVILVLIEDDLKDQDVKDEDLKMYMKMNTYLKWNDPWFWHKLKYALPHHKNKEENKNIVKEMQQKEKARELDKIRTKLEQVV